MRTSILFTFFVATSSFSLELELERATSDLINNINKAALKNIDVWNESDRFNSSFLLENLWINEAISVALSTTNKTRKIAEKVKFCVMIFDDQERFLKAFQSIHLSFYDIKGFYIVVFTLKDVNESLIFETMWRKSFYNVIILKACGESVVLSTFFPFQTNKCQSTQPVVINTFIDNRWTSQDFFPSKLKNFHRCPVKVGAQGIASRFVRVPNANGSVGYIGKDVAIMKLLGEALNFQPVVNFSLKSNDWGGVYENGSSFGVINQIIEGYSDFILGYFVNEQRSRHMDCSNAYFFFSVIVIIPLGAPFSALENMHRPFELTVWLAFLSTITLAYVLIVVARLHLKLHKSLSNFHIFLGLIFGESVAKLPKQNSARIFLIALVMFCLIVRTAYQSKMFNFFQAGHNKAMVKNLADMEERKFSLYVELRMNELLGEIINYPEKY